MLVSDAEGRTAVDLALAVCLEDTSGRLTDAAFTVLLVRADRSALGSRLENGEDRAVFRRVGGGAERVFLWLSLGCGIWHIGWKFQARSVDGRRKYLEVDFEHKDSVVEDVEVPESVESHFRRWMKIWPLEWSICCEDCSFLGDS